MPPCNLLTDQASRETRRASIQGDVIDRHSGERTLRTFYLVLNRPTNGHWLVRLEGGPTGFESFRHDPRGGWIRLPNSWCACIGRSGEYDTRTFDGDEMRTAHIKLGLLSDSLGAVPSRSASLSALALLVFRDSRVV